MQLLRARRRGKASCAVDEEGGINQAGLPPHLHCVAQAGPLSDLAQVGKRLALDADALNLREVWTVG